MTVRSEYPEMAFEATRFILPPNVSLCGSASPLFPSDNRTSTSLTKDEPILAKLVAAPF